MLEALFGCVHRHTTFPQTPIRRAGEKTAPAANMYVACLDCGKSLPYDWNTMRAVPAEVNWPVVKPIQRAVLWVRFIAAS